MMHANLAPGADQLIQFSFTDTDLSPSLKQGQEIMAFDAMAAAVDWLDAYRAGEIDLILSMFADDAVIECGCDSLTVTGKKGLRAYWEHRLREYPASALDDLRPDAGGAKISYEARPGLVGATLEFDADGRISRLRCAPSAIQQSVKARSA